MNFNVKYLVNWTQYFDLAGGVESRYFLLSQIFPDAELVSAKALSSSTVSIKQKRLSVDKFLQENTQKGDIIIRDAGVGGTRDIPAKVVVILGNAYATLRERYPQIDFFNDLIDAEIEDVKKAFSVIANSNFIRHQAEQEGCRVDVVIPNGVDTKFWYQPQLTDGPSYILWIGDQFKNPQRAARIAELTRLPFRMIEKRRISYGWERMRNFYHHAKCLLVTSSAEGNSNVILEALSCGVPIVTNPVGWFWDADIKGAGEFLPEDDKESAEVILSVVNSREKYDPRDYIFRNGLDKENYANRMKAFIGS